MSRDAELERALVRAIVEGDPDDDEPRLVYADYLQSRGDARGELIAMQCREARVGGDALENRSIALFDDNVARWAGAWHGEPGMWRYRRGFLDELAVPLDRFAENAQVLFELEELPDELIHVTKLALQQPRAAPSLEAVASRHRGAPQPMWFAEYAASDAYAHHASQAIARLRLRELALQLVLSLKLARALAQPSLAHVTRLAIESPAVERHAVLALLEAPLARLTALRLCCRLADDEWAAVADAPRYRQVRSLEVAGDRATIAPLIRANPSLTTLRVVHGPGVRGMLISDPVVRGGRLPGEPTVVDILGEVRPPLVELDISRTHAVDLTPLQALHTLERLDMHGVAYGDVGLAMVLQLPRLAALNIAHTGVTADGLAQLVVDAPPSLRALTISTPRVPRELLERLAKRFALRRL